MNGIKSSQPDIIMSLQRASLDTSKELPKEQNVKRRSTRITQLESKQEEEKQRRLEAKRLLQLESVPDLSYNEQGPTPRKNKKTWQEPPLAEPVPIVTGLPLSSFPSKKILKEALWPRKKISNKKNTKNENGVNYEEILIDSDDEFEMNGNSNEPTKTNYEHNLKTSLSEPLTELSEERLRDHKNIHPVAKEGTEKYKKKPATKKPIPTNIESSVPSTPSKSNNQKNGSNKKIKRSPKKNRGNAFGFGAPDLAGQKRLGAFDFEDTTKDNEDFCSACGGTGIFLCCEACPKSFHFVCCDPPMDEDHLPEGNWYCNECLSKRKKLKKYNVGIFSKLLNQCEMRNPRKFELPRKLRESTFEHVSTGPFGEYQDASVIKNSRPVKVGKLEESDPLNIYDKDGKPLICYKCGSSGLEKQITKCGYCDLSWHLDCLNPPLPTVKTLGTKWKCPNHVSDLIPDKKRRFKKQNYVDVSMSRGFKNNGDVEIIGESDDSDSEDEVELPTPPYLQTFYKNGEIHAPVGEELEKIITMNNITYRIPERGVILDFIQSSKIKKLEGSNDQKEFLESISEFHKTPIINYNSSFKDLLSVVNSEFCSTAVDEELSKDEIEDLKYLKKLIEIKGKENLLKFLQN